MRECPSADNFLYSLFLRISAPCDTSTSNERIESAKRFLFQTEAFCKGTIWHPLKGTLSREKSIPCKKISPFLPSFGRDQAVARRSPFRTRWSNRSRFSSLRFRRSGPDRSEGVKSFLPRSWTGQVFSIFPFAVVSLGLLVFCLDGTRHPSGSRSTG